MIRMVSNNENGICGDVILITIVIVVLININNNYNN